MNRRSFRLAFIVLVPLLLAAGAWWEWTVWQECRADGHSVAFCARLLVR